MIVSKCYDEEMGRPKKFSRFEVLEKSIQLFWRRGFADTTVQDLEKVTGVNKSGLYTEFKDKDELFLASLEYYANSNGVTELLSRKPLGWQNIEDFLKAGLRCSGKKGCFMANTVREAHILPTKAKSFMMKHFSHIRELLLANVAAVKPKTNTKLLCDLIITFNSGICLEQNLAENNSAEERIKKFIELLKN